MNTLIESGILLEKRFNENFLYILNDSNDFFATGYRMMQNQNNMSFVRCMKLLYNGKLALYYDTRACRPFENLLPILNSSSFLNLVSNLLRSVLEVKNNGLLSCQNIDLAFEKFYVNGRNLTVCLIYTPWQKHLFADYAGFDMQLRTSLTEAIHRYPALQSPATASLERNLSDPSLSLSSLSGYVRGSGGTPPVSESNIPSRRVENPIQQLRLIALRTPTQFELVVDRDEYIIGRKADAVHGVIPFNGAIGRVHCKITRSGFGYRIEDLGSANGTYVNRQRLLPHKPVAIKNGDLIRLANSDFQVLIQ